MSKVFWKPSEFASISPILESGNEMPYFSSDFLSFFLVRVKFASLITRLFFICFVLFYKSCYGK